MRPAIQKIVFALVVTALCVHFIFLVNYANPFLPAGSAPPYRAQWYAYPFFHQGWNLFVPPPRSNYHLYVQCRNREGAVRIDLVAEVLKKHRQNPLLGYGGILVAITNSIHYFEQNTSLRRPMNGPLQDDLNYSIIARLARSYVNWSGICPASTERVILLVEDPAGRRVYFN